MDHSPTTPGESRRHACLRYLSLSVAVLTTLVCALEYDFNVYANALKTTLNYTQSEVELSSSFLTLGGCMSIVPTLIYNRIGFQWTFSIGAAMTATSFFLLWLTVRLKEVYEMHSAVVAVFHMFAGHGMVTVFVAQLFLNIKNVNEKHQGKYIASLSLAYCGGGVIMAQVYDVFYANGEYVDYKKHDLKGFFLLIAIVFCVTWTLGIATMRDYSATTSYNMLESSDGVGDFRQCPDKDVDLEQESIKMSTTNSSNYESTNIAEREGTPIKTRAAPGDELNHSVDDAEEVGQGEGNSPLELDVGEGMEAHSTKGESKRTFGSVVKRLLKWRSNCDSFDEFRILNVHLAMWNFAFAESAFMTIFNNATAFLRSLGFEEYTTLFTTYSLLFAVVLSFSLNTAAEWLYNKYAIRQSISVAILSIIMFFNQLLLLCWTDTLPILATGVISILVIRETSYSLTPTILCKHFGTDRFGTIFAVYMLGVTAMNFVMLKSFGAFYDNEKAPTDMTCYGKHCFTSSLILTSVVTFCGALLGVVLVIRKW